MLLILMFLMVKTAYCDELKRLFYMKSVKEVELSNWLKQELKLENVVIKRD